MLSDYLWEQSQAEYAGSLIVRDPDGLWLSAGMEAKMTARGFEPRTAVDAVELRFLYEKNIRIEHEKCVIRYNGAYLPYDMEQSMRVYDASIDRVFPFLDADTLRSFSNLNYDLLTVAYRDVMSELGRDDTEDLCCGTMWQPCYLQALCSAYCASCNSLLDGNMTREAWMTLADRLGFMLMAQRAGAQVEGFEALYDRANSRFPEWMKSDYGYLSGTPAKRRPHIMNQVQDYIRRNSKEKIALIVMDGMSFADYQLIRRDMARDHAKLFHEGLFSFVPSITSVARQSLFSGKLPYEHAKPFDLTNEERQFRAYWKENGVREDEIFFAKSEAPEWPEKTRIAGIVVNIVDDLMHNELQGGRGMYTGLKTWLESGTLSRLIGRLKADGFSVWLTADHGNTSAIAQGRFQKPSVITENASRRAAIYQSFAGAEELDKFDTTEYSGPYMPEGYRYFAFAPKTCCGDKGMEYISHGGMTIEEIIVPFVRIGD